MLLIGVKSEEISFFRNVLTRFAHTRNKEITLRICFNMQKRIPTPSKSHSTHIKLAFIIVYIYKPFSRWCTIKHI